MRMKPVQKRFPDSVWRNFAACLVLAVVSVAVGQDLPQPRNHVEDRAGVISQNVERQLIAVLADLERKTGAQMIALTINTTGGVEIEDYALRLAERWKLGQAGEDNGALAVIAVKDHKYWITVGYDVESVLPDGFVGSVGRKYFQPYFRQGDYSNGIYQGMLALVQQIAKAENVSISGAAAPVAPRAASRRGSGRRGLFGSCGILPFIVMIVIFSILRNRAGYRRRWGGCGSSGWLTWMLLGSMLGGGRRRHGGWGGGGFGGGGFGGGSFGGGGGGGFGGGGAGGSW